MRRFIVRFLGFLALIAASASPALAQSATTAAPVRQYKDANGVDLLTGEFTSMAPGVTIGDAESGLSFSREIKTTFVLDSMLGAIYASGSIYTVSIGQSAEKFTLSGGVFTPVEQNGSTLTVAGATYTYRAGDGTVAVFTVPSVTYDYGNATGVALDSITYPNGKKLTFYYRVDSYQPIPNVYSYGRRLQSVTSNTGYHIKLSYMSDIVSTYLVSQWMYVTKVMGLNDLVDSCSPSAFSCTGTGPRPTMTVSLLSGNADYTDSVGNVTHYEFASGSGISAITLPGSSTANITVAYTSGKVSGVTSAGVTTTYAYSDVGATRTTTVTRGSNSPSIYTFDTAKVLLLSSQNELGKVTSYQYDTNNRLTRTTLPEGNYTSLTYD